MNEAQPAMLDAVFALTGRTVPREPRRLLADALQAWLPWLATAPGAGVHRLKVVADEGEAALLSQRARLVLRAPRTRLPELLALAGCELDLAGHRVRLGPPGARELLPYRTLYAEFVAAADDDEAAFLRAVDGELGAMGVKGERICGRRHVLRDGASWMPGFSLMLDGLSPTDSLRVLEAGLGAHRRLGCGLFVPHRSAAAVVA